MTGTSPTIESKPSEEKVLNPSDILFVAMHRSAVGYYRCALPAMFLGADWVGIRSDNLLQVTGLIRKNNGNIIWDDYKIIVWQQPKTDAERAKIKELRDKGIKVLVDVDDYLHGVRKTKHHDFKDSPAFKKKNLKKFEAAMRESDGIITTTDFIAKKYGQYNRTFICKNGLDLGRYYKHKYQHNTINIGWSGATGHTPGFAKIVEAIDHCLEEFDNSCVITVGQNFAEQHFGEKFGGRAMGIPFSSIEIYPNAISMFDIALAPMGKQAWHKAKSNLRLYECAAMGAAVIADPHYADEIEDGVTGFIAETEDDWEKILFRLCRNESLRKTIGMNAKKWAYEEVDMMNRRLQWASLFEQIADEIEEG